MEQRKRTIVTTVFGISMVSESLVSDDVVVRFRKVKDVIEELENNRYVSALKDSDRALIGTLNDLGIEIEANPIKVKLLKGDVLLVLNPNVNRLDLANEDYLPDGVTITATAVEVWDSKEYAKAIIDGLFK